jgi:hypothetical protein
MDAQEDGENSSTQGQTATAGAAEAGRQDKQQQGRQQQANLSVGFNRRSASWVQQAEHGHPCSLGCSHGLETWLN